MTMPDRLRGHRPPDAASLRGWLARLPIGRSWSLRLALLVLVALIASAIVGQSLLPGDANAIDLAARLRPPSWAHWLGTDHLGRDIFLRLLAGAGVSLGSVALCLALVLAMGIAVGGAAGVLGGRADQAIMRVTDVFLTFPTLVLSLFMVGVLGSGLTNVIIAIALSHWAWYARIVRGIVLSLRERDFILAARLSGAGRVSIFIEHLLPATASQLLVLASLDIGHMMLHVAGLSFLGLGVAPPMAEWGVMINDARQFVWTQPMLMVWPGVALFVSVMTFNLLGDALRDRLDPHLCAEHGQ
ncbi:nickel ABC transporter permease subunit NikC [Rhodospirillum rubrum]|uniref:nickel ABC transporter permease subunit NikC n=1 Tax=Rhodospirillum rubrum TaxID=1085 RepID=UPI0019077E35|nr:nickel ABC transporter permease subunit NikC [Rhodospirillum rubrum]MBK1666291.1 nickel ABC transporter permease subunit NikC [Rhodospirillum rubrum]MBK1677156.1 nickel ABC transporter permease subunit NikC [Rhodospirillum rubrum]